MARDRIKTTCPRDCYDACGIEVEREDGNIRRVLGDKDHAVGRGTLCAKCAIAYNGVWIDPEARLTSPLRRTGPKGGGGFEAITWEAALDEIVDRLGPLYEADQGNTILTGHYTGTCSAIANGFPMRFFNRIGATEIEPDSICNLAGHMALDYVLGTGAQGFDPRTVRDSKCIVVWGANPSAAAPHAHRHWLPESPGTVVVIDPIRTPTAAAADIHLQPRPGSDAALAFAMLHVIRRDDLLDRDFLASHTVGFEELAPSLDACTPEWGEAECGVPAGEIERVARLYGEGPSLLWLGQGLQRQSLGGNIFRAVALLPALSGNIGKPGAGICFLNGKGPTRGMDMGAIQDGHLREAVAAPISHMDLIEVLGDADRAKALVLWNINIMASNPRQRELRQVLRRDDLFTVVVDPFMTDSADEADIVLPAASFLEFDDLVGSYFHLSVGAQTKAAPPPGDALPNQEIFRRLARRMGFTEPELFEDDRSMIDKLLDETGLGIDFEELKTRGTVDISPDPVVLFADRAFPTPSGKIEIASDRAEAAGHPRVPAPTVEAMPEDGKLRLLSPASPWAMNSSYANEAKIQERLGEPTLLLHPSEATARGLTAGQAIRLRNEAGELTLPLGLDDMVPPGVAYCPKGHWPKAVALGANINALNTGDRTDMGDSTAVHSTEVELTGL